MTGLLIYSERGQLPRLIDGLLTLFAWLGFIYLLGRGVLSVLAENRVTSVLSLVSLCVVIVLFNAFSLIGWAVYNQYFSRNRDTKYWQAQQQNTYISYISPELTNQLKDLPVAVVFHNSSGDITEIGKRNILDAMSEKNVVQLRQ